MKNSHSYLTEQQCNIAKTVLEVIQRETLEDSFTAMISIMSATLNDRGDNGHRSQVAAAYYAEMLINTVIAGQEGRLSICTHTRGAVQ